MSQTDVLFPQVFRWVDDYFEPEALTSGRGEIIVADSWRSQAHISGYGRASGFALHRARFESCVKASGAQQFSYDEWDNFWRSVVGVINAAHCQEKALFPRVSWQRIETRNDPVFVLSIRSCPELRPSTSLFVSSEAGVLGDPRKNPRIKGPDISRLATLREKAVDERCDDAVLSDGEVALEATTGSVVWWRKNQLIVPARKHKILPGITAKQLVKRAIETNIDIIRADIYQQNWADGPAWFLNSVQGISSVKKVVVDGKSIYIPQHHDTQQWRDWWARTFVPYPIWCGTPMCHVRSDVPYPI